MAQELPPGGSGSIILLIAELGFQIYDWIATFTTWENFLRSWFQTPFGNFLDWIGVHGGRPKLGADSATDQIALFLYASHNPIVRWYGVGVRALESQGYPISVSSGPGRQRYDRLARAFNDDLVRQWGQKELGDRYFSQWQKAILGLKSNMGQIILVGQNQIYQLAVKEGRIDPKTGFPPVVCSLATKLAFCPGCCDAITGQCKTDAVCQRCIDAACGGKQMACSNTHGVTNQVQGPGVCCAALARSGQTPAVGVRVQATTRTGKCIVCEVKASTSKKNPNALVFKRGRSLGLCPTAGHGCCILQTAAAGAA